MSISLAAGLKTLAPQPTASSFLLVILHPEVVVCCSGRVMELSISQRLLQHKSGQTWMEIAAASDDRGALIRLLFAFAPVAELPPPPPL